MVDQPALEDHHREQRRKQDPASLEEGEDRLEVGRNLGRSDHGKDDGDLDVLPVGGMVIVVGLDGRFGGFAHVAHSGGIR